MPRPARAPSSRHRDARHRIGGDDLVAGAHAREHHAEVRFIEYMDVGGATQWSMERVVSKAQMLDILAERYGTPAPLGEESSAPARRYRLSDG